MSYENETAAYQQMNAAGLLIEGLRIGTPKPVRCKVDGEKGSKGWYWLSEFPLPDGAVIITGSFGVWHGSDNGKTEIMMPEQICQKCGTAVRRTIKRCPSCKEAQFDQHEISKDDLAAIRKKSLERKRKLEAELARQQAKADAEALKKWRAMQETGTSGYLTTKQVDAFGVRFSGGALAVPMRDTAGKLHGLQFILDKSNPEHKERIRKMDGDKRFWPTGLAMAGHFHQIGAPDPTGIMLITEGYATGASLHMATKLPVAVVFSANNVLPVLLNLEKAYGRMHFLICADDDFLCRCKHCKKQTLQADADCAHCGQSHGKLNTGVTVAMKAAMSVDNAEWIIPEFTARIDDKTGKPRKLTDFNDLHCDESLQVVTGQIQAAIADKFPAHGKAAPSAREPRHGGAGKASPSFMTVDDACARYALVYGVKDTMFDGDMFKLVPKSCVLDITPDHAWRDMKRRADFRVVDIDQVGFDPTESDPNIICNMWGGWPTVPDDRGSCDKLLELLAYMCSEEKEARNVYRWLECWLAYPLKHPGAKMKTAVVVHGGQGVGKNLFFEAVMSIYGEYGRVVGQSELEEKFNEWASRKLFLIANEVMARSDLFHQKNKVKALITDDWIHINPKNVASHDERNHLNMVFLSNEAQPVVLDPDDRRFMAIWTPKKRDAAFYRAVLDEIADGGIAALHHYLLNVDLGDFNPGTPPMSTRARRELIEISKESPDRFIEAWLRGELDAPCRACALGDLYVYYARWCRSEGERFAYAKNKFSARIGKHDGLGVSRKPVTQSNGSRKVVCVVLPDDDPKPDGEPYQTWLSARIRDFRLDIDDGGQI